MRQPTSTTSSAAENSAGNGQAVRLRHFLNVLENQPTLKIGVATTLRSIVRDSDALALFSETGLPGGFGLLSEAVERLMSKILPVADAEAKDLGHVFSRLFPQATDASWLAQTNEETLQKLVDLLHFGETTAETGWNTIAKDMQEAMILLANQAQAIAFTGEIRRRLSAAHPRSTPFYGLIDSTRAFVFTVNHEESRETAEKKQLLNVVLGNCRREILYVRSHLQKTGVSLAIVYHVDRLETILVRMETLAQLIAGLGTSHTDYTRFLMQLIEDVEDRHSLRALWRNNMALMSRRIVERNAETGDHYITRSRSEYMTMLYRAAGGGAITSITVFIKILVQDLHVPYFIHGLIYSANYASSFLAVQFLGFTLATKQPAMTAATLAAHMTHSLDDKALVQLARDIIHIFRSQVAAIVGNLALVIPSAAALHFLIMAIHNAPLLSQEEAWALINAHSLLGASVFYAAFTGCLLWLSAVVAGWADNLVAYRRVAESIGQNRRLRFVLGLRSATRLSEAVPAHAGGIASNVSLGVLLGMTPKLASFIGLPVEVRHVTLSAGVVTFASLCAGPGVFSQSGFWLAVAGVVVIGFVNVAVSFWLALSVAMRAKRVESPARSRLYRAVASRILKHPLRVILPVGLEPSIGEVEKAH